MSGRSSRRKKTQNASKATLPENSDMLEDVRSETKTDASYRDKLLTSSTQHMPEAHTENEQSSSSVLLTDNSISQNRNKSSERAARERTSTVSNRLRNRHKTDNEEADDDDDKEPAVKRRKKTNDTRSVEANEQKNAAKKSVLEDEETLESEGEWQMETDENDEEEQDSNSEQHVYGATGSESDFKSMHTRESLMSRITPYKQRKQTLSDAVHSSAESSDSWRLSTSRSGHFTSAEPGPRRRAMASQAHRQIIPEHQYKSLQTYHLAHAKTCQAVEDSVAESPDQQREHSCERLCSLLKYFVTTCVIILCAVLLAVLVTTGGEPYYSRWLASIKQLQITMLPVNDQMPVSRELSFERLREEFPNQTGRLWRIIEAATLPIIEEDNPTHPAVILLVAAKGSESVAECLAQRYALLVTESLNAAAHTTISCETYADSDPDDAKGQLDSRLSSAFGGGSKSAVVLHLEKLPGPAAMIFYRFADNDNAPYKDVTIVLTLTLESTDTGSEKDHVAYDELRKVWGSSLDVDKVEPLLSRIGNSVAFVRPETSEALVGLNCRLY